jgi:hypothetical protein
MSKDTAIARSSKPDLDFHPGAMGGGVTELHNNTQDFHLSADVDGTDLVGQDFPPESHDHRLYRSNTRIAHAAQRPRPHARETTPPPTGTCHAAGAARGNTSLPELPHWRDAQQGQHLTLTSSKQARFINKAIYGRTNTR